MCLDSITQRGKYQKKKPGVATCVLCGRNSRATGSSRQAVWLQVQWETLYKGIRHGVIEQNSVSSPSRHACLPTHTWNTHTHTQWIIHMGKNRVRLVGSVMRLLSLPLEEGEFPSFSTSFQGSSACGQHLLPESCAGVWRQVVFMRKHGLPKVVLLSLIELTCVPLSPCRILGLPLTQSHKCVS